MGLRVPEHDYPYCAGTRGTNAANPILILLNGKCWARFSKDWGQIEPVAMFSSS